MTERVSYGRRVTDLAERHPERAAVIEVDSDGAEHNMTWIQLDRRTNQVAHLLARHDVGPGANVAVAIGNGIEHLVTDLATWKLGACVIPLARDLPPPERDRLLGLAAPAAVVATWPEVADITPEDLTAAEELPSNPLPDRIPQPGRAIASGGTTGKPKLIVLTEPLSDVPGDTALFGALGGLREHQVQLVAGPLYHNMPHAWSHAGLFHDHTLVVMRRFDASLALDLIERHQVNFAAVVPTHLHRMLASEISERDLSSIEAIMHAAAPCPPWLKRAWIDLLGPDRVYEGYGATEAVGFTAIRGDEWLERPRSVGRPVACDLRILDPDELSPLRAGEVGEIYMRPHTEGLPFRYIGAAAPNMTSDGYVSVGDLGWLDDDGFLYLAGRRTDLIITGGANVYPAEVEAALSEHPEVADVAVVGVPDPDWGNRVHAFVQPQDPHRPPDAEGLLARCRKQLAPYKVPKGVEFIDRVPRNEAGKLRRSKLVPQPETNPESESAQDHRMGRT